MAQASYHVSVSGRLVLIHKVKYCTTIALHIAGFPYWLILCLSCTTLNSYLTHGSSWLLCRRIDTLYTALRFNMDLCNVPLRHEATVRSGVWHHWSTALSAVEKLRCSLAFSCLFLKGYSVCPPTKPFFSSSDNTGTVRVEGHTSILYREQRGGAGGAERRRHLYRGRTPSPCLSFSVLCWLLQHIQ